MLSKDRIRLMTQLAAYEQGEGKEYMPIGRYRRRDYVSIQMIKSFFYATIAFGIFTLLQVLYGLEEWLEQLYLAEYQEMVLEIVIKYLVFILFYQVIAWIVYNMRYRKGHKNQKAYQNKLKKVEKLYEREEKQLPSEEWGQ